MRVNLYIATACFSASLSLLNACGSTKSAEPTPTPSAICSTYSGLVTCYTGLSECLNELVPVAPECNEKLELPWCITEDDAIDGAYGPTCFWKDPVNGSLWYNDGDGMIAGQQ